MKTFVVRLAGQGNRLRPVAELARVRPARSLATSATCARVALAFVVLASAVMALAADKKSAREKTAARADENPYLDKDGKLKQELVLIDSQGGFAGFSGHRWTIAADGAWRREPFLNEKVRKAEATGKLSSKQLAALADRLAGEKLLDLPKQIGPDPMVNPHIFTLKFGKHETALVLPAGAALPKFDPKKPADDEGRFVRIATTILDLLKTDEKQKEGGK
jgi:hypothetical protein